MVRERGRVKLKRTIDVMKADGWNRIRLRVSCREINFSTHRKKRQGWK